MKTDIFGLAMLDYLKGERGNIIRVDTNLTEGEELPVDYLFRSEEELPEWETLAMSLCKGKILDVGAGAGCHSLILQKRGFDVTAIDIAPVAVQCMKERGIHAKLQDYYTEEGKYDTLLFLMNGIGMALTMEGLENIFTRAKSLLNEGGQIILESSDIIYMFEEEDGSYLIDLNGDYYGEMEYTLTYKGIQGEPFPWLYVGYELLSDKAEQAGFNLEFLYQGEEGNYLARLY
ncbi:MAG TPA: class I SAM-dependent methyltransferase [Cytophagaceae bacterium]|jgi:SAM-dependent methyltransferase|nr:class I SAM-dependent methyltransferase [Cytophagaceae bacterium]